MNSSATRENEAYRKENKEVRMWNAFQ